MHKKQKFTSPISVAWKSTTKVLLADFVSDGLIPGFLIYRGMFCQFNPRTEFSDKGYGVTFKKFVQLMRFYP